ncbi:MAG: flagellar basal-body rod protein FlgG [candidate division FCPU426 bacterium]
MMRALWTSASGMMTQQFNMDVLSNNLANVNTTGFKKSRAEFQDLLYEHLRRPGTIDSMGQQLPLGVEVGHGAMPSATQKIFSQGEIQITNNPLDILVNGEGFFQIAMPDGSLNYTRAGNFKMDGNGRVATNDGHPLEPALTIPAEATGLVIRENGQVEITLPQGQANQVVGQIMLAKFMNNAGLESQGNNLFSATDASGEVMVGQPGADGIGKVGQGMLENSNVQVVEEMVNLIVTQRAYEANSKAIKASDDMLSEANNLRS